MNFGTTAVRSASRRATAWSILDWCAAIGVAVGLLFWLWLYLSLYQPTDAVLLALVLAVSVLHATAMPMLWSALIPTTPAGQLLQRTKYQTVGFYAIIAFALFLTGVAGWFIFRWQLSFERVTATTVGGYPLDALLLTIVWLVLSIGVPALALVQLTPEQWVQQIMQWRHVQRLELAHKQDLLLLQESTGRALAILRMGLDRATIEQRRYVADVVVGLHRAEQENLRLIAATLRDEGQLLYIVDPDNAEFRDAYQTLATAIEQTADESDTFMSRTLVPATVAEDDDGPAEPPPRTRTTTHLRPPPGPATAAGEVSPPRPAASRRAPPRYAAEYETARRELTGMWTAGQLGAAVGGKSERTARDWLAAWEGAGLVARGESKGAFYFTEGEGA